MWSGQYDRAIAEASRAVACNPSNALAYVALENTQDIAGEPEQGIPNLELGLRLNPLEPRRHFAMTWLAGTFLNVRKYDEALSRLDMAMFRQADNPLTHLFKTICHFHLGDSSNARRLLRECENAGQGFAAEFIRWRAYELEADTCT